MITVNNRTDFLHCVGELLPKEIMAIELGVFKGGFSAMILHLLEPKTLYLVDPFEESKERYGVEQDFLPTAYSTQNEFDLIMKRFNEEIGSGQVNVNRKYSYDAVKDYPDNYFNFLYIDASHLYKDVKKDLNDWLPKLKEGGLMCLHDYVNIQNFGVIQAVDEWCVEQNFKIIIFNEDGGDVALKQK